MPFRPHARALALAFMTALAGCNADTGDPGDDDRGGDPSGDGDAMDAGGGDLDEVDASLAEEWAFGAVRGVPNLDDDDGAAPDWEQAPFAADDDRSSLVLSAPVLALVPAGGHIELSLAGAVDAVKIWSGDQLLLGAEGGVGPAVVAASATDVELVVDFGDYNRVATLTVAQVDASGTVRASAEVELRSAPLILNHHLQPAEHIWAMAVNGNQAFIATYEAALGDAFSRVSSARYAGDVWVQDELEFATATGAAGQRLDVVIDSIRDRGLDDFPEDELVGPGTIAQTWGDRFDRTTYDSFGNLEASPPVTVGGVEHPFGRVYYGGAGGEGMDEVLPGFLAEQMVQAPFAVDTTWLCVGHVDEVSSFVPDPSSPKGFKLLLADTRAGWDLVASVPADASIGRFGPDHGYPTAGSMLGDPHLVAVNEDVQLDHLDPIRDRFVAELGLTDEDIILVPSLFESVSGCGGRVAALVPGMVNLIVANVPGEPVKLLVPDPFFRASDDAATDPFRAAFAAAMPAGNEVVFVDNWDVYHLGLGEVHCGTNVRRTPTTAWWTTLHGGE